jgi:hypothetical protein
MTGRFPYSFFLLLPLLIPAPPAWAAEPAAPLPQLGMAVTTTAPTGLVVLRNGEIISGRISRDGDRTIISSEGTEIRLSPREVDFVCQTLDEAYTVQHNRIVSGRIDDHLNLAEWCMRHELFGYAAREITAAMQIDPKSRRVALLDDRLRRAMQPEPTKSPESDSHSTAARPVSTDELERLVRSLPASTVETFTSTVQPMLLNYCATAGCHGPSSQSSYTLSRAPLEKIAARRLTERNLYNTLQWIDRDNPLDSKLLSAARDPHGPNQASGATGVGTTKYQELVNWVLQASPSGAINSSSVASRNTAVPSVATLPLQSAPVLASPSPASLLVPSNPSSIGNKMPARSHKPATSAPSALSNEKLNQINAAINAATGPAQPLAPSSTTDAN